MHGDESHSARPGPSPTCGTTTTLLNLSVVAATLDKRRLALVDAHLVRPTLAQRLGLSVAAGLQEVLAGNAALETAVLETFPWRACPDCRPRPKTTRHGGTFRSGEALAWLFAWLKERFDLVLIDGPCTEEAAEIITVAALCDGMYLVVVPCKNIVSPRTAPWPRISAATADDSRG